MLEIIIYNTYQIDVKRICCIYLLLKLKLKCAWVCRKKNESVDKHTTFFMKDHRGEGTLEYK